jgi:predicted metal-dependent hydrolase
MQLALPLPAAPATGMRTVRVGTGVVPVEFVRHRQARRYILRITDRGVLRVTIPRGGSAAEAERVVRAKSDWVRRERFRALTRASRDCVWTDGTTVYVDGEPVTLRIRDAGGGRRIAVLGAFTVALPSGAATDVRETIERALRAQAEVLLPGRLRELAALHRIPVSRVSVRGQRTRWGSCSPSGHISLNWRLVQMPPDVRDYVLLHELTHLAVPDHSPRFWHQLARVCPGWREARAWLRGRRDDL